MAPWHCPQPLCHSVAALPRGLRELLLRACSNSPCCGLLKGATESKTRVSSVAPNSHNHPLKKMGLWSLYRNVVHTKSPHLKKIGTSLEVNWLWCWHHNALPLKKTPTLTVILNATVHATYFTRKLLHLFSDRMPPVFPMHRTMGCGTVIR